MSFAHHARGFKTFTALRSASLQASVTCHASNAASHSTLSRLGSVTRSKAILSVEPEVSNESESSSSPTLVYNHGKAKPLVTVLKDNFVTSTLPTTCASLILNGFKGPQKSTVGELLQNAGVKVVAKTNMDEFGMGSHSMNSAYGPVQNGIGEAAQSAGGSSGGSAMAVADSMVHVAIGSDTGGSVRLPAAYTGTVGFKPSYGRISRNGLVPYANSLDTVGIISNNVYDASVLYKILNRPDPADPTCQTQSTRQRIWDALRNRDLKLNRDLNQEEVNIRLIASPGRGERSPVMDHIKSERKPAERRRSPIVRRIGVPDEYNIQEMHPLVRRAWVRTLSMLESQSHKIVPMSLPSTQQALAAYYVLAPAEASSNLAKYDGVRYGTKRPPGLPDNHDGPLYSHYRGQFFGDEVKRRILLGTFSLSAGAMDNYFIQAQKVRRLVQRDFNQAFRWPHPLMDQPRSNFNSDGVDLIIVPTAPTPPPLLSDIRAQSPLDSYINDVFTVPASLAGLPAISIPVIADDDLPPLPERSIGMQVIGQYGDDLDVLNFARMEIEANMNFDATRGARTLTRNKL